MPLPVLAAIMLATTSPVSDGPTPHAGEALSENPVFMLHVEAIAPDDSEAVLPQDDQAPVQQTERDPPDDEEDIIVEARTPIPGDPLEQINVTTYAAMAQVDAAVVAPVARVYERGLPRSLRNILSNFFANLREPIVALNYLLQLKPGKAVETLARFAINSTAGFGGINDVARERPFHLPRRANGFANTLGYYGVGSGPFLVLPLVGATTLRDVLGGGVDQLVLPTAVGRPLTSPFYGAAAYTINSLDFRIEFDAQIAGYRASGDPYGTMRTAYLARRTCEIEALHGRIAAECGLVSVPHPVPTAEVVAAAPEGNAR